MTRAPLAPALLFASMTLAACGEVAQLPVSAGIGPNPTLPAPNKTLLPTVNIAPAQAGPPAPSRSRPTGMAANAFATALDHPRWVYVLPNGDVLVAESNAPPKPEDGKGLRGWVMGLVMKRAGAGTSSADRITLLRDVDGDGVAETRTVFIEKLASPIGMALIGDALYIANTDAIVRYPYTTGTTHIDAPGLQVAKLPGGAINHHWTKNILASPDGRKLYATVGSNSNVG